MRIEKSKQLLAAICLLVGFALWTVAVSWVDVQPIGPMESAVGFAALNRCVQELTGLHMELYYVTDWLSLVPLGIVIGFSALGLMQWVKRKSLWKVDASLLCLGGFYLSVFAGYILFEALEINYRPVLIEGVLEVSYPSSTTLLVLCVIPTAMLQWKDRLKESAHKKSLLAGMAAFLVFMVMGRIISGVHWFTDIVGGGMLSVGLVLLYDWACSRLKK